MEQKIRTERKRGVFLSSAWPPYEQNAVGMHNELSFITPSLQTDGKLTIDGYGIAKIDNVLITSGSMEYKYFEGLKSGFEDGYILENALDTSNILLLSADNFKATFENNTITILHQPSKLNHTRSECYQYNAKFLTGKSNISYVLSHNSALHGFFRSTDKYVYAIHRIII